MSWRRDLARLARVPSANYLECGGVGALEGAKEEAERANEAKWAAGFTFKGLKGRGLRGKSAMARPVLTERMLLWRIQY
eukprot:2514637-Rhodomonas_salina.1